MQEKINTIWDYTLYLQLMASFCNELDFDEFNSFSLKFYDLVKTSIDNEVEQYLPAYEKKLNQYANVVKRKYPITADFRVIAKEWNDLFKTDKEVLSNGIPIGWLEQFMDLKYYYRYDYYPYHFKVGLVIHKGRADIEEHFLLKDAFKCLTKAAGYLKFLNQFGKLQQESFKKDGKIQFDKSTLSDLNLIKSEVSFYSRLTIISFYSFLEAFVNSIGFDFYYRGKEKFSMQENEILRGSRKGRFISLKAKIENFQKIIRKDKTAVIVLSDAHQISEPFKTIFDIYEDLRNSAVHNSPDKTKIWIKPHDWHTNAENFSRLVIEASKLIWQVCHETTKGPDYLGRLDYDKLYAIAEQDECHINRLERNC
jgi:hypothetical protein